MTRLDGFLRSTFEHNGIEHVVYRRGRGPAVLLLPEIPGITPATIQLAKRLTAEGFTVLVPHLFGRVGAPLGPSSLAYTGAQLCVSREFRAFASRQSSPVTDWLRALGRSIHAELGGLGIGAIGMCFTGNFALAMAVDDELLAPVLSQPALPFGLLPSQRQALHLSDEALARVKDRCAKRELEVLGLRFTQDLGVPKARFDRLARELGDAFERIEIDSSPGNRHGIPVWAHSVLTTDLVDEAGHPTRIALDRVISFLKEKLQGDAAGE